MRLSAARVFRISVTRFAQLAFACLAPFIAQAPVAQALTPPPPRPPAQTLVEKIEIHDTIQPISAGRLERAIAQANRDHAAALLVVLDTPGGLLDSTRHMVGSILGSQVPVIVYVAPAGARAASAGFFLLEAADVAAMAPGTNAGAAHPVLESGVPDETMRQKMENDAAAFLRSYAARHNRNAPVAESAVRESKSFSADEALDQHLIDLTADDEAQLLAALDGRAITRNSQGAPASQTLHLRNPLVVLLQPTLREQLLGRLANPNLALLLLVGGAMLIYLEFNIPGTIVPGALGTVMVLLAAFALDLLPIRHTAVLLLLAAAVLMLLEVKFTSHGILSLAGIACLAFGTLTLIDAPIPELAIQPVLAISVCIAFSIITFVLLRLAVHARRNKARTGPAALVGFPGVTMEQVGIKDSLPVGRIQVQGEIWQAISNQPIPERSPIRVTGFQKDLLVVEADTPMPSTTPPTIGLIGFPGYSS
jgi:membrane-bound serine protease (ClpP class)